MNRTFALLLALPFFALLSAQSVEAESSPNVIVIITDDQGYGDFGATGNKIIETPNLDAMAKGSASMSTYYVHPVCSPTRACLMTGRYNYRTRCIDTWVGRSMMEPEEVTLAEFLSKAGYATGIFGKWHLGDAYPMRAIDQGFDEALIHKGGGLAQPSEPRENNRRYTDPILFHNGKQVQTKGYCTDVYFDAAMKFIEKNKKKKFFIYLPTNAPHGPFHDVPEDLRKHYLEKDLASLLVGKMNDRRKKSEIDKLSRVAAMITNVDQNVGRLFKQLKRLGLTENTLVVYMNDNGPNGSRYVGDFRGAKGGVNEGGVRSPLWMHWPAQLKAGYTRNELSAHIDIVPTILAACDVTPPANHKFDGHNLLPLLQGKEITWSNRTITIQSHRGDQPTRYHHFLTRDDQWKLVHPSGFGREGFQGEPKFELYDLINDPGERNNLVEQRPEVVQRLKKAYDQWFDDVSSTRPNNYAPPRIHVGTRHESPTILTRQDWRSGTWAPKSTGHWEIYITKKKKYDITLEFDAGNVEEQITLTVGDVEKTASIKPGDTKFTFEDVKLPRGNTRLMAVLSKDDNQRGIYQAFVD